MPVRVLAVLLALCCVLPAFAADKGVTTRVATASPAQTSAPRRLALVVGNGAYRFAGSLANPARDAELMREKMDHLNRIVERVLDYARSTEPKLARVDLNELINDLGLLTRHKLKNQGVELERRLDATLCWLSETPLSPARRYVLRHTTRETRAQVAEIAHRVDLADLERKPAAALGVNDIGEVSLRLAQPVFADPYSDNRATGAFIVVDEATNDTVGAGMIR